MEQFEINPEVDREQEFLEIATDFSNPLDLIRETISNSFDAGATKIEINFEVIEETGDRILHIYLNDNGKGMGKTELQAFFDLGNSTKRGLPDSIGEKGHGTKVFFNSSEINVITSEGDSIYEATMKDPFVKLCKREKLSVKVIEKKNEAGFVGTKIHITGYNKNQKARFTHEEIKDYVLWFTKIGSVEREFGYEKYKDVILLLKGLDRDTPETIKFGHVFPKTENNVNKLFDKHGVSASDYYCNKIVKQGSLKNSPEIKFDAVFYIEGNKVKQTYNNMIRRPGKGRIPGDYKVEERYGLWLCKDFIPIHRKRELVTYKGGEYVKFHAFINCQALRLTANRGSVENTPAEILDDIYHIVDDMFNDILAGDDWQNMDYLEEESGAVKTKEMEEKTFQIRIDRAHKANVAKYKNAILVEPQRESGVYGMVIQLMLLEEDLFPFYIIDYDTHQGIDVIVKSKDKIPLKQSKMFYIEFKHTISSKQFNHTFENTSHIICWDSELKNNETVKDLSNEERKFVIVPPEKDGDHTRYFLDNPRNANKIEIFILKDFLKQKLNIEFRPRTDQSWV